MAGTNDAAPNEKAVEPPGPCQISFTVDNKTEQGSSSHFNERGMLIACSNPLPLNKKLKLALQFPGFKNVLELQGEVVWTNIYGPNDPLSPRGMGVKFMNLERDTERLLADLATQYNAYGSIYNCLYT